MRIYYIHMYPVGEYYACMSVYIIYIMNFDNMNCARYVWNAFFFGIFIQSSIGPGLK